MKKNELKKRNGQVVKNQTYPLEHQVDRFGSTTSLQNDNNIMHLMQNRILCCLPISAKIFISAFLVVMGLSYCALLGNIWIETQMSIPLIVEGYSDFGFMGLIDHSFRYLSWFAMTFFIMTSLFLFSTVSETLKRAFAVVVPLLIISDIGSAWLIRYHDIFAWQLAVSGFLLATSFLIMFICVQADLWFTHCDIDN